MGTHVCIEFETEEQKQQHKPFLKTYAEVHGLEYNECTDSRRICIGIGTGPMAEVHRTVLNAWAQALGLPVEESDEPCPEE